LPNISQCGILVSKGVVNMTKTESSPIFGFGAGLLMAAILGVVGFIVLFFSKIIGGIILFVAAVSVLSAFYGAATAAKGPCPYCGETVAIDSLTSKATTCRTCQQRIIVRDNNLYKLDEIAQ
jgi:hypothetical protein